MELLTFYEAAALCKIHPKTLQRHAKKGALQVVLTPFGKRIPKEALAPYLGDGEELQRTELDGTARNSEEQFWNVRGQSGTKKHKREQSQSVPLEAHLATLQLLDKMTNLAEESQRQVLIAERTKLALEVQLGQYQRVLSEQAESLAEERSKRIAAETKQEFNQIEPAVDMKISTTKPSWGKRLRTWILGDKAV